MSKKIAVAMTHGHAAKWLQVAIHSMKRYHNDVEFDIFVAQSNPLDIGVESIKGITETWLGDNVTIIQCDRRHHSHATGLEMILEHIAPLGYEYMFCTETDCRAMQDGWLDWFYNFLKDDPKIGMAGFFWHENNNHYNINASGTLYRVDMLMQYHNEVRANNSDTFWHPKGNRQGTDEGMDPTIKDVVGCFAETRGIENPTPAQLEVIKMGIPQASWWEPGAWVYCRMQGEWDEVGVPNDHVYYNNFGNSGHHPPKGTFYGSEASPYLIHYWGGTRAWDHLKHPVNDQFVKGCSPHWLNREDEIWRDEVPEDLRERVIQVFADLGLVGMGYDEG